MVNEWGLVPLPLEVLRASPTLTSPFMIIITTTRSMNIQHEHSVLSDRSAPQRSLWPNEGRRLIPYVPNPQRHDRGTQDLP